MTLVLSTLAVLAERYLYFYEWLERLEWPYMAHERRIAQLQYEQKIQR
jgi:hypothetical protein